MRKREGHSKVNSSAVAVGSNGNGLFNWVKNSSNQLLMAVFGNTLYKMEQGATTWDGTFDAVSADASNGTAFGDSIVHFATYSGTLLFTTEGRDKPQRMLVTENSHFDIDYNGSGTAPNSKYIQVWKEQVWLLNLGGGGVMTENCDSISTWTDNDTSTGASTQETFSSEETFRFLAGGTSGHDARRTRDIGTLADNYTIEMRAYFDTLDTIANGDYALVEFYNGVVQFSARFSDDGLEIYDGTNWNEVGVDVVAEDTWATWKFIVTAANSSSARVEVLKDSAHIGLNFSIGDADATNDGQIDLHAKAGGNAGCDWYLDYLYINSSNAVTEYYTDGDFGDWVSASAPSSNHEYAAADRPITHYKCNDNAASTVVTDNGSDANNAVASVNTSVITSTGKISSAFSVTSASSHNIAMAAATVTAVKTDTVGSITMWVYPDVTGTDDTLIAFNDADADSGFEVTISDTSTIRVVVDSAGAVDLDVETTNAVASASWTQVAIIQDGSEIEMRLNNAAETLVYATSTDKGAWFDDAGGSALDRGRLGCKVNNSDTNVNFYDGRLDDIRIYSRAVTSFELDTIYNSSSGTESQGQTVRQGTTFKVGTFSFEARVLDSSNNIIVAQTLGSGSALSGVASVFGCWTYADANFPYFLRVYADTAATTGSTISGNGAWQYNTLSFTPTSGAASVRAEVVLGTVGTVFIDQASVIQSTIDLTDDLSDRVQRSAIGLTNDWDGTDSGTNDIVTSGDIGLTGSAILFDAMYVFKKYSIHKFTYTGSTPLVEVKEVSSRMGTSSPRSIRSIELPELGEVLVFLGTDRVLYAFDGAVLKPLSDNISVSNGIASVYMQNINSQALDKVHAVVHDRFPWYELFVPIDSATDCDYSITYDFVDNSFWPNDNRDFRDSTISDRGDGLREVYVIEATTGFAMRTVNTNSDDGTNINGYWTSGKIGVPTLLSKMDEVNITTESVGTSTPTFSWRADYETSYVDKTFSASTNQHNYNLGRIDNLIQFKMTDDTSNPTFKLHKILSLERGVGHGR